MITFRRVVIFGSAVIVSGAIALAGFLVARHYEQGEANALPAGEKAYERAVWSLDQENPQGALLHLEEALLQANRAAKAAESFKDHPVPSAEERRRHKETVGRIVWLRARAVRDQAFARLLAEGKLPLARCRDRSGDWFLGLGWLGDDAVRRELMQAMRQAAALLQVDADVLSSVLGAELQTDPINLTVAVEVAAALQRLQPDQPAALFVLALNDYEQPGVKAQQKSRQRLEAARERILKLKSLELLSPLSPGGRGEQIGASSCWKRKSATKSSSRSGGLANPPTLSRRRRRSRHS